MKRFPNPNTDRRAAHTRRGGFTLIELLVRLALISTLIAAVFPKNRFDPWAYARAAQAEAQAPNDLVALCETLEDVADERARDYPSTDTFPRYLWSIVDRFPSDRWPDREFERLDGGDLTANGMRYTLEIDPVYVGRHGLSLIHDGHLKFAICATPYTAEMLKTEYCIKYDRRQGGCLGIREFSINDTDYETRKQAFLEEIAYEVVASAMADGATPEDLAELLRLVDLNAVKQTVVNLDADGDHVLTLQEIKDLEQSLIYGDLVHLLIEYKGIGKYGEQIDQIGVPLEDLIIDESPARILAEYHGLAGALMLEEPSGEIEALAATVNAAQRAVETGAVLRELHLMNVIEEKGFRAWDRQQLSTEGLNFLEYSLELRREILDGEEY